MSEARLEDWIERTESRDDIAGASACEGLAATLDHASPPWREGEVPPLGHWLYFPSITPQSGIGPDGHAKRGGFLPPVNLPRRMWAAGELQFIAPIPFGSAITRVSTVRSVFQKTGRSGPMVFVDVEHTVSVNGTVCVREVHTIVYRGAPPRGGAPADGASNDAGSGVATNAPKFWRDILPDPVLLFRYSALTFNGHRIHYDREYCKTVEDYPGLVVHGPLTATLLLDLYLRQKPGTTISAYRFRAHRPLFDIHPFKVCGTYRHGGASLWALNHEGAVAMTAELETA